MVSDITQKQITDIQEYNFKRLLELTILVPSLTVAFFIMHLGVVWARAPYVLDVQFLDKLQNAGLQNSILALALRNDMNNAFLAYLEYEICVLAFTLAFLIGTVWYFWRLQNKTQFHVLFIGRKKDQEQINTNRFFTLGLILVVDIATGLSSFSFFDNFALDLGYNLPYSHFLFADLNNYLLNVAVYSMIIVAIISVPLSFIYLIKPYRVQQSLRWLLLIPIFLSLLSAGEIVASNVLAWGLDIYHNVATSVGTIWFMESLILNTHITLRLASFIVLFYLAYQINAEYGKFSTHEKEEHLRGVIDEGIWILPKRVHTGDSYSMSLDLKLSEDFSGYYLSKTSSDYLEGELQAVGLEVDGEKQVRIYETSQIPVTTWNCRFAESGVHTINLLLHLISPRDNARQLIFARTYDVKVRSFLSVSLVTVFALIVPILVVVLQALLGVKH